MLPNLFAIEAGEVRSLSALKFDLLCLIFVRWGDGKRSLNRDKAPAICYIEHLRMPEIADIHAVDIILSKGEKGQRLQSKMKS